MFSYPVTFLGNKRQNGVLDNISVNIANVACGASLRRLTKNYYGKCARVIRATGGVATDIGFDYNGYISQSECNAMTGSGDFQVLVLYDQSGNNNHLRGDVYTATQRPVLAFTGSGVPYMVFDGDTSKRHFVMYDGGLVTQMTFQNLGYSSSISSVCVSLQTNTSGNYELMGCEDIVTAAYSMTVLASGALRNYNAQYGNYIDTGALIYGTTSRPACVGFNSAVQMYSKVGTIGESTTGTTNYDTANQSSIVNFGVRGYIQGLPLTSSYLGNMYEIIVTIGAVLNASDMSILTNRCSQFFDAYGAYPEPA